MRRIRVASNEFYKEPDLEQVRLHVRELDSSRMNVLAITGSSGTGKTTAAKELERLGAGVVSIGSYLRQVYGSMTPNAYCQKFGMNAGYFNLWPELFGIVAEARRSENAKDSSIVVIESIYSAGFYKLLQKVFPDDAFNLIEITAHWEKRLELFRQRHNIADLEEAKIELIKQERMKFQWGLSGLYVHVDATVHNDGDTCALLKNIRSASEDLLAAKRKD